MPAYTYRRILLNKMIERIYNIEYSGKAGGIQMENNEEHIVLYKDPEGKTKIV
ncbi:hypothetical protein KH172YL63_19000 [Bacillus sp. KH172YL63]|nr:hypothetical protein KH172YL63_19000 [Bacillus sp. KH172YL63]